MAKSKINKEKEKEVTKKIRYIQSQIKSAFECTYNAVQELKKLHETRDYQYFKNYVNTTFKVFLKDNFNLSWYRYGVMQQLVEDYNENDFNQFGPAVLAKVSKSKHPDRTLRKLRLQINKDKVVSITAVRKILREDKPETKTKRTDNNADENIFSAVLKEELILWIDNGWILPMQAQRIAKAYKIRIPSKSTG